MTASFDDYYPSEPGYDPEAAFFAPELITSRKGRFLYKFRTLGGRGPLNGQKGLLIYGQVKIEASAASAFGPQTLFLLESELPAPAVAGPSPSLSRPSPASDPEFLKAAKPAAGQTAGQGKDPVPPEQDPVFARFVPYPDRGGPGSFPNPFLNPPDRSQVPQGPQGPQGPRRPAAAEACGEPELLPGGGLFLDPKNGWLMALAEALPGSGEKWPASLWPGFDPAAPIGPGVSFIWTQPENLSQTVESLLKNLNSAGQTLVISGLDSLLNYLAAADLADIISLTPKPTGNKDLDKITLESRVDGIKQERKERADKIREEFEVHRAGERQAADRVESWTRLRGLIRSLSHLRAEASQRQSEWTAREIDLIDSQKEYDRAEKGPGGIRGLLGRKNNKELLERSKAKLDAAEKSMRRTRLEIESLLSEARTVESELAAARDMVRDLDSEENLIKELAALRLAGQRLASQAASLEIPVPEDQLNAGILSAAKIILSRSGAEIPCGSADNLIIAAPVVTDPKSREDLTAFACLAKKRLIIAADFTSWSWTGQAPVTDSGQPAWRCFIHAGSAGDPGQGPPSNLAKALGPLPAIRADISSGLSSGNISGLSPASAGSGQAGFSPGGPSVGILGSPDEYLRPNPAKYQFLMKMGFSSGLAKLPVNHPAGPSLRAFADNGPFSPVSALNSVRLAVEASRKAKAAGEEALIYVMTGSRAQAALARSLLSDFGRPGGVMAGEPKDFELWPKAAMVILDTALAEPQTSNSLTSPEMGRPAILRALSLASGALVVSGAPDSMEALPPKSPLSKLWAELTDFAWPGWLPLQPAPFWDVLDKAKNEVFMVLPPFTPDWWPALAPRFMSALRRKVRMTIISELPPEESRDYPGQVIRELRLYGASVVLSEGFADALTLIDGCHFSAGAPGGPASQKRWPFLVSLELPRTVPLLMDLFQYKTIQEKLGPGGLHGCPLCGWPYVLVNQGRIRDFNNRQALRLGCLNPACSSHKRPRRLDERWPFTNPPVCPHDKMIAYVRSTQGRSQSWVCPKHGSDCPSCRCIPGDCPSFRS